MPVDDQELRAITFLAMRVRRATNGCAPWDETGVIANLRKIANRNLHHVIEHTIRHAADPAAKNPGVLVGSYTPEAPKAERMHPPKKHQECRTHPGQWADNCGLCRNDHAAGYLEDETPDLPRWEPKDPRLAELLKTKTGDA